jgi:hypothetical protein
MKYDFSVTKKQGYLHIKVLGDNAPETVHRWLADGLKACAEFKCSRVLIEENLSGKSLTTIDTFFLVAEGSKLAWQTVTQVAYLNLSPEQNPQELRFIETVAVNRGLNLKVFTKVADAEKWLESTT